MNFKIALISAALVAGIVAVSASPQGNAPTATNHWSSSQKDRKYEFSLVTADGSTHSWGSWNSNDVKNLGGLTGDRMIVKKQDGSLHAITDKRTLEQAEKALKPVTDLGRKQGELGRKQGELGRQQGSLGRQMGEFGRQQGLLGREMGQIARDSMKEETRAAAEKRRDENSRKMADLGLKMDALGKQQSALGSKQSELGKQQGELGRRQAEASAKAQIEIEKLIDQAFEKGLTKPIKA